MTDRTGLPSSDDQDASVFSLLRRGGADRYMDDITDYNSDMPSSMNFKEPPKIQPRKSKYYTLYEEVITGGDGEGKFKIQSVTGTSNSANAKKESPTQFYIGNVTSRQKVPGEILREQYATPTDTKKRFNQALPHGSVESTPGSDAQVKLFGQAHQTSLLSPPVSKTNSVSLPSSPHSSPKLEKKFGRNLSSQNLFQFATMGVVSQKQTGLTHVQDGTQTVDENKIERKLSSNNLIHLATMGVVGQQGTQPDLARIARDANSQIVKKERQPVAMSSTKSKAVDERDSSSGSSIDPPAGLSSSLGHAETGFSNWFKKKVTVGNRDLNVFSPSSS